MRNSAPILTGIGLALHDSVVNGEGRSYDQHSSFAVITLWMILGQVIVIAVPLYAVEFQVIHTNQT